MRIDAHHHFWHYNTEEYGWIDDSMREIQRSFLPEDLSIQLARAKIDGVVSVQARQTLEETHWLLKLAEADSFIKGVVGWLPLASADFGSILETMSEAKKLKGLRHVVQGEAAGFLDQKSFNRGIQHLTRQGLVYDILILAYQLEEATRFVDRHPQQVFVLDHIAKPCIRENQLEPWAQQIHEIARRENVVCKLSGMVTEADYKRWTPEQLRPYLDTVLSAFGPQRLMFGSDWPVCLVSVEYDRWVGIVEEFTSPLSADAQVAIFGETARRIYRL